MVRIVSEESERGLVSGITQLRKEISKSLGFVVPGIRIRDDIELEPSQYQIKVGEKIVADDEIMHDKVLAIPGDDVVVEMPGLSVKEPAFGVDALWIEPELERDAQAKGYITIDPISVLITHLRQVLNDNAGDLLGQDEVQTLVDNLEESQPNLVQSVIPKVMPLHQLTKVLQNLLREAVPISDLSLIIGEAGALNLAKMQNDDVSEALRPKLIPLLIQRMVKFKETIPLITFAPNLEQLILTSVKQNQDDKILMLDGTLAKKILSSLNAASESLSAQGKPTILIVAPQIRQHVSRFVRSQLTNVNVLSFVELPENRNVEIVQTIGETEQSEAND